MLFKVLYFIVPTCLFLALSMASNRVVGAIQSPSLKLISFAGSGAMIAGALYFLIRFLARRARIPEPFVGKPKYLIPGMALGLLLSAFSGLLFSQTHQTSIDSSLFVRQLYPSVIKQIPHALTEEVTFRNGIVGGIANEAIALIAGSLPFGVLHAVDIFFGVPVSIEQVIGVSLAGLLLTVLYLRFGLWAAVGLHYAWNLLVPAWVLAMHLPPESGASQLEGAWTTSLVILGLLAVILRRRSKESFRLDLRPF